MTGKVWLVGAGPGDRGLFTLKGLEVLSAAEVVVYDALVGEEVLTLIPRNAELVNVGKRAGNHLMAQEEINMLLLRKAQEGKRVVRLKGGDPFLFGRGGEELELLAGNGIPYEVVPGVTSAIAVPAYNGIPVTHRDYTSSVHIITGHRRRGGEYDIDFQALVRTKGTLIFLMGLSSLGAIMDGLLAAGMDPEKPAAVLEKGTTAGQRRIVATVATLEKEAERAKIGTPAIIVVGDVCALAEDFAWYEKRPLAGKRILVTRPREHISEMSSRLRKLGAEVMELPAIETEPITPNEALESYLSEAFGGTADENLSSVPCAAGDDVPALPGGAKEAVPVSAPCSLAESAAFAAGSCDWIVFTSPTGVKVFMDFFLQKYDVRDLWRTKLAVIGRGSAKALREYGLKADFMPTVYDGETLGRQLRERILADKKNEGEREREAGRHAADQVRVLIPRARIGNKELILALKGGFGEGSVESFRESSGKGAGEDFGGSPGKDSREGFGGDPGKGSGEGFREDSVPDSGKAVHIEITDIPTYETVYTSGGPVDAAACVRDREIDYAVFTSASTVRGFCAAMQKTDLAGLRAICIGKQTKAAADAYKMKTRMAACATLDALVDEVIAAAESDW
ncbi:MAG: uroporphyrinogen-III C-methyltransferase [Eubacteriales bacterium]|nr:uroporphyrinogen-III C-methyltransferase [Eubacteriales bacterium]